MAEEEPPALVAVRVRVFIRHAAMRGPAGVGDADFAREWRFGEEFGEIRDAPDAFAHLDFPARQRGDARRVVAAIFQPSEAVEKDRDCLIFTDITDDAAHDFLKMMDEVGAQVSRVVEWGQRSLWRALNFGRLRNNGV